MPGRPRVADRDRPSTRDRLRLGGPVALLFFLSGVSSLVYETAWSRLFQDLFGHSVHTNAAVLAGFMAGLGLGAAVCGAFADRVRSPLRLYGILEVAIVALVWTSPWQVATVDRLLPAVVGEVWTLPGLGLAARWFVAIALVILPTSLMGATLPVLCRALTARSDQLGRVFGLLYGVNTLGAVVGVLAAGLWLIRDLGVTATLRVGCAIGLAAGIAALLLASREAAAEERDQPPTDAGAEPNRRLVPPMILAVVLASGATALAYEVIWIRLFVFILDSNILSFTAVLGSLLAAMGVGSLLLPRLIRRRDRHLQALGWIEVGLGLTGVGSVVAFLHFDRLAAAAGAVAGVADPFQSPTGRLLMVAAVVVLPGLLMGAALPAATGAITDHRQTGRGVGLLYAWATAGNIVGSLGAGYVLVPVLGAARSLVLLAAVNLALGALVLGWRQGWRRPAPVVAGCATLLLAPWLWLGVAPEVARSVAARRNPHAELLAMREGLRGTVTVSEVAPLPVMAASSGSPGALAPVAAGYRMIAVDGVDVAGTSPDLRTTQRMQAHIPLLLHGAARRVLQVGFGSGETTREALLHGLVEHHVAELNPDVMTAARRWFPELVSTGYETFFGDARNTIRTTRRRYDVILNDSTYPGIAGSSLLYSADHLRNCRDRLEPGGFVSTWLPVDLPPESLRVVLATWISVFPESSFWLPTNCLNKHGVLVGSLEPQSGAMERLARHRWPPEVRASLAELGYDDPALFASIRVLDGDDLRALAEGAPVNSDDHPILEYPARGVEVAGEGFWLESVRLILSRFGPPRPGRRPPDAAECVRRLLSGQLALLDGDAEVALGFYERAALADPRHPGPRVLRDDILIFRAQAALDHAFTALATGDLAAGIDGLARAVELWPRSAVAQVELGRALVAAGDPVAARPHLEAALALAPDHPEIARLAHEALGD
jgi:spermidine synthase